MIRTLARTGMVAALLATSVSLGGTAHALPPPTTLGSRTLSVTAAPCSGTLSLIENPDQGANPAAVVQTLTAQLKMTCGTSPIPVDLADATVSLVTAPGTPPECTKEQQQVSQNGYTNPIRSINVSCSIGLPVVGTQFATADLWLDPYISPPESGCVQAANEFGNEKHCDWMVSTNVA